MDEEKTGLREQLVQFWSRLPRSKRVALVVVTTTVLLGVVAISILGSRIRYAPLYKGLNQGDSAAIAEKLKELKVPHRVTSGGVEVPRDQVHELRLELAATGLPRGGGVGFEIFDNPRLGATEFEQQVNLRRALEGELARSISTIQGVQSARVHLVLPERRLFAAKSEGASASVVVRLQPGFDFGRREVAGVVHLVSAAVPALSKDRISVVSTEGVTLHRPDAEGSREGLGLDETQNQAARELASSMESHVRTLLERVTGPGGVDIRIHVDLEESVRERTEEHYEPTRTALRSEHKSEETSAQEGATVAGVPGAQTNLPDVEESVAARSADLDGNIFRRTRTRNWEVDRITETITTPSGDIARVSAAVLIDGIYTEKEGEMVYAPRDPEQLRRLEEIVKNAIGFDAERGDTVRVEGAKFTRPEAPLVETNLFDQYKYLLPYALAALGVLTFLLMLIIFWRAVRAQKMPSATQSLGEGEQSLGEGEQSLGEGEQAAALVEGEEVDPSSGSLGTGEEEDLEDPELLEEQRVKALNVAGQDPATAAIVISGWLNAGVLSETAPTGEEG